MANIIDFHSITIDSLYQQLSSIISEQKKIDEEKIKEKYQDDIDEYMYYLDTLEADYTLYQKRLEFVKLVQLKDEKVQKQYLETLYKMDCCDTFNSKVKMMMMLSYGVLVNNFKFIQERTDEALFMLSFCSSGLYLDIEPGEAPDLDDYTFYIGVLSDKRVSERIVRQTDDFAEQTNIAYDVMDKLDQICPERYLTSENFEELISASIQTINDYEEMKSSLKR